MNTLNRLLDWLVSLNRYEATALVVIFGAMLASFACFAWMVIFGAHSGTSETHSEAELTRRYGPLK